MRRLGLLPIAEEQGRALFDTALASDRPQALALPLDMSALREVAAAGVLPRLFSLLIRVRRRSAASGQLVAKLTALPESEHEAFVLGLVRSHVAAVLGRDSAADVPSELPFKDQGFDSLAAVELRNSLVAATAVSLSPTMAFDYPSAAALAEYLLEQVKPDEVRARTPDSDEQVVREAIASIPFSRLRQAGVVDQLMRLAELDGDATFEAEDHGELIDAMDVAELVRRGAEGPSQSVEEYE
jgi:acyl carrier protein